MEGSTSNFATVSGPVKLEAGEIIAYAEDLSGTGSFDFGVMNLSRGELAFVNVQRYRDAKSHKKLYSDCPYRYYADSSAYAAKYSDAGGTPASATYVCGRNLMDVAGTIAGAWFSSAEALEGLAVALEPSGTRVRISIANESAITITQGGGGFVDPASVTTEVCYFVPGESYIYLKLISATELSVVHNRSVGVCPGSFASATGTASAFIR